MSKLIGGPSFGEESCPTCQKKHKVRRRGSWDWQPKLCEDCKAESLKAAIYKQESDTDGEEK